MMLRHGPNGAQIVGNTLSDMGIRFPTSFMGELPIFSRRIYDAIYDASDNLTPQARSLTIGLHFKDRILAPETVAMLVITFMGLELIAHNIRTDAPLTKSV